MSKLKTFIKLWNSDRKKVYSAFIHNVSKTSFSHLISDKLFLKMQYKATFGKKLDLKNPKTYNEKLQWLKLYNRKTIYTEMVDKYEAKKYVSELIGEEYIIPTLGVWDNFDDIDFDKLPDKFVIKCTHDSGSVVICRDKNTFDLDKAKTKINKSLKRSLFWHGREWPYKNLKPRIIAEQYLEDEFSKELSDYKFYCFNGEPRILYVSRGLENHETARISFVTLDWEQAPVKRGDFKSFEQLPPKPKTFDLMMELAKKLSENIPFLRVDFYDINGQLYFGELTFFPGAGFTVLEPEEWDYTLGNWIRLPEKK